MILTDNGRKLLVLVKSRREDKGDDEGNFWIEKEEKKCWKRKRKKLIIKG